jgi:hypothetical protein
VYQRKPPEELHLGERLRWVFAPTGRIPPESGGWHRDLVSGSVAGARTERPLLIPGITYRIKLRSVNSTEAPLVLCAKKVVYIENVATTLMVAVAGEAIHRKH